MMDLTTLFTRSFLNIVQFILFPLVFFVSAIIILAEFQATTYEQKAGVMLCWFVYGCNVVGYLRYKNAILLCTLSAGFCLTASSLVVSVKSSNETVQFALVAIVVMAVGSFGPPILSYSQQETFQLDPIGHRIVGGMCGICMLVGCVLMSLEVKNGNESLRHVIVQPFFIGSGFISYSIVGFRLMRHTLCIVSVLIFYQYARRATVTAVEGNPLHNSDQGVTVISSVMVTIPILIMGVLDALDDMRKELRSRFPVRPAAVTPSYTEAQIEDDDDGIDRALAVQSISHRLAWANRTTRFIVLLLIVFLIGSGMLFIGKTAAWARVLVSYTAICISINFISHTMDMPLLAPFSAAILMSRRRAHNDNTLLDDLFAKAFLPPYMYTLPGDDEPVQIELSARVGTGLLLLTSLCSFAVLVQYTAKKVPRASGTIALLAIIATVIGALIRVDTESFTVSPLAIVGIVALSEFYAIGSLDLLSLLLPCTLMPIAVIQMLDDTDVRAQVGSTIVMLSYLALFARAVSTLLQEIEEGESHYSGEIRDAVNPRHQTQSNEWWTPDSHLEDRHMIGDEHL